MRRDKLFYFTRGLVNKFTNPGVLLEILEAGTQTGVFWKKLGRWGYLGRDHLFLTRIVPIIRSGETHWDLVLSWELHTESNTGPALTKTGLTSQRQSVLISFGSERFPFQLNASNYLKLSKQCSFSSEQRSKRIWAKNWCWFLTDSE